VVFVTFDRRTTELRTDARFGAPERSIAHLSQKLLVMLSIIAAQALAYIGMASAADGVLLPTVGCNATALVQIPGIPDLFLGRQLLTADGAIAGITGPNDCSGGNSDNQKSGKVFNRWALSLSRLDWSDHKFTLLKVVLDTSIDPATKSSRAIITGGPMKGAVIRSAYDPDIVRFRNTYFAAYECTIENGTSFGVQGTSSCVSVYDSARQKLDLSRTQVLISGTQGMDGSLNAAAVPELLVYHDRLFIYWSALAIEHGHFKEIDIRGAELSLNGHRITVRGAGGRLVHSLDEPATTQVWAVDAADVGGDTTADLRAVWVTTDSIVAAAGLGGRGCTTPSDPGKGCFRLVLAKTNEPLAKNGFGRGLQSGADTLPSNAQEYTRPIRDASGAYWFIGHYIRPAANGQSDANPMPSAQFWQRYKSDSALVLFAFADKSLWPAAP
jgi:hypothetical protein